MKKENRFLFDFSSMLKDTFGEKTKDRVLETAKRELALLREENKEETPLVKNLTYLEIYPLIGLYRGLLEAGIPKEEAVQFLHFGCSKRTEPKRDSIRSLLKLPGLYRLYPKIFGKVAKKQFGEKAGFRATFYPEKGRCRFDMTKCLYCDTLKKYGYPELISCFCHTDDVANTDIHKNLLWHRTNYMGQGDSLCDFDLRIVKEKK